MNARRSAAARRLPDVVRITRVADRTDNPDGTVTPTTTTIYQGPGRVRLQNLQERSANPPGATQSQTHYAVVLPAGAPAVLPRDVCEVLESDDQAVVGAVLAITTESPLGSGLVTMKLPAVRTT